MNLTILTPTYNRAGGVKTLWESLRNQTIKDFEWLVVDDGSTDNTKGLIEQLKSESDFPIRYIYKSNGGKHTALNVGIKKIESELTFIVDSDDHITKDAVASILEVHKKYASRGALCGYTFLRAFPDGKINGKRFNPNEKIGSYIDVRVNGDDTYADKAEVFYTHCLKEFPFPEYPGEKFLGEDLVWIRMARKYDMVHINEAIYVSNYMEDGLTKNRRKHNITSPIGCMYRANEFLHGDIDFKYRVKAGLQLVVYGLFAKKKILNIIEFANQKGLVVLCVLPAIVLYICWNKAVQKDD